MPDPTSRPRGPASGGAEASAPLAPRARLVRWAKRAALAVAALIVVAAATLVIALERYERDLPSTAELKHYRPPQVTRVLARDGTLLGELFVERRTLVAIGDVPSHVKLAFLAAEDASFYEHAGLNYFGMLRALLVNLRSSEARQGGSTITQQVIKNVLLTPERTFDRKVREVLLARRIEQELSKDEILELYLNFIYFGHSRYGVEEAARYYFGKSVRDVSLGEAALLAAVVKGPGLYSPRIHLARSIERRAYVLDQMVDKGFATPSQIDPAKREPIALAAEPESLAEIAPEVVEEARRTLRALVGDQADRGGYTITTTIDPALQAAARAAVRRNLDEHARRHKLLAPLALAKKGEPSPFEGAPDGKGHRVYLGVVTGSDDERGTLAVRVGAVRGAVDVRDAARYNPGALLASQLAPAGKVVRVSLLGPIADAAAETRDEASSPAAPSRHDAPPAKLHLELGPESALVALDVRTRETLALIGGYEALRGGLDRTRAAHRQPGSTFKPFVYSYGLHARLLTPATILAAGRSSTRGSVDEGVVPPVPRLREAVAQSVNAAAIAAIERVGPANVVAWARALGIESKLGADLSLALGAYEVTPREMAAAYATFAAGGVYAEPALITRVVDASGASIPLPARAPPRRVMDEAEAYLTTSLLQSVVERGTGRAARALRRPVAGKTGTSNQAKDAWFVGYTPDVACAVWTGYDDAVPLGAGEAGATAALPAFVELMREAHKGRPAADFAVPAGLTRAKIDPATGLLARDDQADALDEIFLAGTEPTELTPLDAGVDGATDETDAGPTLELTTIDLDAGAPRLGPSYRRDEATPPEPRHDEPPPF
jgi:penicillin-binding protein 1A